MQLKRSWFLLQLQMRKEPPCCSNRLRQTLDERTILIADNYMKKTIRNLHENPRIALIPQNARECPTSSREQLKYLNPEIL